jgi:hypothetical protein
MNFWLVFCIGLCYCTIINTPGILYYANGETYSSGVLTLSYYASVIITNSTLHSVTLDIHDTYSLQFTNNIVLEPVQRSRPSTLLNIPHMQIKNNLFNYTTAINGILTSDPVTSQDCYLLHEQWVGMFGSSFTNTSLTMDISNNTVQSYDATLTMWTFFSLQPTYYTGSWSTKFPTIPYSSVWPRAAGVLNFAQLDINDNIVINRLETNEVLLAKCTSPFTNQFREPYNNKTLDTAFLASMALDSVNCSNIRVVRNEIRYIGYGLLASSYPLIHSPRVLNVDSVVTMRMGNFTGSLQIQDNVAYVLDNATWPIPIRNGLVLLNSSLAALRSYFGIPSTLAAQYQDVPNYLSSLNPRMNMYHFRTRIEPNLQVDPYSGWDDCHYACKDECTSCIYTDTNLVTQEFSSYSHDICYNRQVFSNSTRATRQCRHPTLKITGPVTISQTSVISCKNRVDGTCGMQPRYMDRAVLFEVADALTSPDEHYMYTYDRELFLASPQDTFFVTSHPYLIMPDERWDSVENGTVVELPASERVVMTSLNLYGLQFRIHDNLGLNRHIFGIRAYSPNTTQELDLTIENCLIYAYNINPAVFTPGFHLINNNTDTRATHSPTFWTLDRFRFINNRYLLMDLLTETPLFANELIIEHNYGNNLKNGFASLMPTQLVQMHNNSCYECSLNYNTLSYVLINGTMLANHTPIASGVVTNNIFANSLPANAISFVSVWNIQNLANLVIIDNTANAYRQIGMIYNNIGNIPCTYRGLIALDGANPLLNGVTYDFYCSGIGIGCKDDTCFADPSLMPPYCIVNTTYPVTGYDYRIMFFRTLQDCIYTCLRRLCYVSPELHVVSNLLFRNYYIANETLRILALDPSNRPIIIGSEHAIAAAAQLTDRWSLELTNLVFFNPYGVASYEASFSSRILRTADVALLRINLTNIDVYAFKPVNPTFIPYNTTTAYWHSTFLPQFSSQNAGRSPYIREPNVEIAIQLQMLQESTYNNIRIFGARRTGLHEARSVGFSGYSTTVRGLVGENMWSQFYYFAYQYNLDIQNATCDYWCGGQYPDNPLAVAQIMFSTLATRFVIENNKIIAGPSTITNNQHVSARLLYGNPFTGFLGAYSGKLAGLWIQGMDGSNWREFRFRHNQISGWPRWIRLTNSANRTIHDFNNFATLYDDLRYIPRQLLYSNDPTNSLGLINAGTPAGVVQVKLGDILGDDYLDDESQWCNDLCPPDFTSLWCTVHLESAISSLNYHSITTAIRECIYPTIVVVSPIVYESVVTDLSFTSARTVNYLTIRSFSGATIIGTHYFNQTSCSRTKYATTLTIQNVNFVTTSTSYSLLSNYTLSTMPKAVIHIDNTLGNSSTCALASLRLESVVITLQHANDTGLLDAIRCDDCIVSQFTLLSTRSVGYFRVGIKLGAGTISADKRMHLSISSSIVEQSTANALLVLFPPKSLILHDNEFRCDSTTPSLGCLYLYGALVGVVRSIRRNIVYANQLMSLWGVEFSSYVWNLGGAYTLAQIATILNETTDNSARYTRFGLHIISDDIDSVYPCVHSDQQYINGIVLRNIGIGKVAITDSLSSVITMITNGASGLGCLLSNGISSTTFTNPVLLLLALAAGLVLIAVGLLVCLTRFNEFAWGTHLWGTPYLESEQANIDGGATPNAYTKVPQQEYY